MKAILILSALLLLGCPRPSGSGAPGEIDCHGEVVRSSAARILPAVNRCLLSLFDQDWRACLRGLIQPAAGVGEDVLACALRAPADETTTAGARAASATDVRRQARAQEFIRERGYRYTGGAQ